MPSTHILFLLALIALAEANPIPHLSNPLKKLEQEPFIGCTITRTVPYTPKPTPGLTSTYYPGTLISYVSIDCLGCDLVTVTASPPKPTVMATNIVSLCPGVGGPCLDHDEVAVAPLPMPPIPEITPTTTVTVRCMATVTSTVCLPTTIIPRAGAERGMRGTIVDEASEEWVVKTPCHSVRHLPPQPTEPVVVQRGDGDGDEESGTGIEKEGGEDEEEAVIEEYGEEDEDGGEGKAMRVTVGDDTLERWAVKTPCPSVPHLPPQPTEVWVGIKKREEGDDGAGAIKEDEEEDDGEGKGMRVTIGDDALEGWEVKTPVPSIPHLPPQPTKVWVDS